MKLKFGLFFEWPNPELREFKDIFAEGLDQIKLSGVCDPRFSKIKDLLEDSLASGFDTGASVAICL